MSLANVTLDDKYTLESGRIYLSGIQALVRLPIMQRQRDARFGLNTACFISGYRGSPLGGLDQALWKARRFLENNQIHFQPGINEDLAATAVWGSQQVNIFPGAKHAGVFAMWYGKGPGVDRSGDVFKHANAAGTSRYGGVLAVAGDDHACKSSTLPHQSEYAFIDAMLPVLNPAGVQEILDLGIFGWELSRYCGCWIGFKVIAETADASASVYVDPHRVEIKLPEEVDRSPGGLHVRWPDRPLEQELRLHQHKLYAALAFARANRLNSVVLDSPKPRLGIVTTGKSYLDVRQALDDLHIDERLAAEVGLRIYKVGMSWPLERDGVREFARGLEEVLVVEEKRGVIENQLKEQLYNWREDVRPRVVGKFDEEHNWILPSTGELNPARIARVIARRIARFYTSAAIQHRLAFLEAKEAALAKPRPHLERVPHYCAGCPHNTSTNVPKGSRALGGIGCHYMATWMDRRTETFTQMGGEGATWIGQALFTETPHVFQNLGDGTYFHSGYLAIRAAVAAGVNITYKILYNDAVAMTGGQPVDGSLTVPQITHQLYGEGVRHICVVSDEPDKYPSRQVFAAGVTFYHRDELDRVQRQLRQVRGVSVLIYDQTCAAEKRRRCKRGLLEDPSKRVFINPWVCEGCGDCNSKSNCLAVVPIETEFGRKRAIDQSACNKDFSCLKGLCPSFVTVHGGSLRKSQATAVETLAELPEPAIPAIEIPYGILVAGVGGTGVVTVSALLGIAAHLEGKGCAVLDMTGLAQKFGPVFSHVRIGARPEDIHAVRIAAGEANLLLGCDLVVAASDEALGKLNSELSHSVVNRHASMPAVFTRNPDLQFPAEAMMEAIREAAGVVKTHFVEATQLAVGLLGDAIAANLFLTGYAFQQGLIPLSAEAIERAIEINGTAVEFNKQAFRWGRRAALDLVTVENLAKPTVAPQPIVATLDEVIARRVDFLTGYQNTAYAKRYEALVRRVQTVETAKAPGRKGLVEAVARYYYKLLAYKDEYEVARLYVQSDFLKQLNAQCEGNYRLEFNLAPPWLAKRNPETGEPGKRTYGPWMLRVFKVLAQLKGLRGTPLDLFGYQNLRWLERQLIKDYEGTVEELLAGLNQENHALAIQIASIPEHIRGYDRVKEDHLAKAKARETELLTAFRKPAADKVAA